jgi:4-carboxymuconolactone decarboxylase
MAEHMAELHTKGRATFAGLVTDGEARLDRIFQAVPALGELAVGTVYGHLHARRTLDPRMREAVALAAIIAAGCTDTPLTVHTRTGLAAGLTPAEIGEIVTETAAFAGFPRAVTAAGRLPELFVGSPIPPDPAPREVLLDLLATRPAALRDVLTEDVQVLTTGPRVAVALVRDGDGTLTATIEAQVEGGSIVAVRVLAGGQVVDRGAADRR